jgi:hypothetical protein
LKKKAKKIKKSDKEKESGKGNVKTEERSRKREQEKKGENLHLCQILQHITSFVSTPQSLFYRNPTETSHII